MSALLALFVRLFGDEVKAWMPCIAARLVRVAVQNLPASERDRFSEEWTSHINEVPGEVKKLWDAAGFVFAAHQISFGESILQRFARRSRDIIAAFVAITLLAPILLVVALLIKIERPDQSVLSRRRRIGLYGKPFVMYQFRVGRVLNNRAKADGKSTIGWKPSRLGVLLLRTYLNELPTFLNVLRGDMTLVGPTPTSDKD